MLLCVGDEDMKNDSYAIYPTDRQKKGFYGDKIGKAKLIEWGFEIKENESPYPFDVIAKKGKKLLNVNIKFGTKSFSVQRSAVKNLIHSSKEEHRRGIGAILFVCPDKRCALFVQTHHDDFSTLKFHTMQTAIDRLKKANQLS